MPRLRPWVQEEVQEVQEEAQEGRTCRVAAGGPPGGDSNGFGGPGGVSGGPGGGSGGPGG